jgi:hypothetical protein
MIGVHARMRMHKKARWNALDFNDDDWAWGG